jgi:hypothetical protein
VTFSLNGYQPQTIPVTLQAETNRPFINDKGESDYSPPRLTPNPVFAELVAMPAAKPAPAKKPATAKPAAAAKPVAASTPQQRARTGASSPFPDPVPPPPR